MRAPHLPAVLAALAILGCAEPQAAAPPPALPPPPPPAAAPAAPAPPSTVMLGGGCEEAKAAYMRECQGSATRCADATKANGSVAYTATLNGGAYLTGCGVPQSTAVKICAAIRGGRALAVTVTTTPGDARVSTCIAKAVQALNLPSSPGLDVTSTSFAAQ